MRNKATWSKKNKNINILTVHFTTILIKKKNSGKSDFIQNLNTFYDFSLN